jgi:hypothetical protein
MRVCVQGYRWGHPEAIIQKPVPQILFPFLHCPVHRLLLGFQLHRTLLLSSKTKLSYKSDLPRVCLNVTEGILRFSPKRILPPLFRPNFSDVSILGREFTSSCFPECLHSISRYILKQMTFVAFVSTVLISLRSDIRTLSRNYRNKIEIQY